MTSFQEVTWRIRLHSEEMVAPCPLVFKLGHTRRFLSAAGVWCDEISFMPEFCCCRWSFPNTVSGWTGCSSPTGKTVQCAVCPCVHCYLRQGWVMVAQLWTVSSFICLDVSVACFHKTSLTCFGPDKRPPYSEWAAVFEHGSIFLCENSLSALRSYICRRLISLSRADLI